MAIRLTIEGIKVECDTPHEVAALIRATKTNDRSSQTQKLTDHSSQHSPDHLPLAVRRDPRPFKPSEFNDTRSFSGSHLAVLTAMKEAFPNGVSSNQLATRIGGVRRSIPIVMVSLQMYAKKCNLRFEDLIVRERPPKGEKGSTYRITDKGLKVYFG